MLETLVGEASPLMLPQQMHEKAHVRQEEPNDIAKLIKAIVDLEKTGDSSSRSGIREKGGRIVVFAWADVVCLLSTLCH